MTLLLGKKQECGNITIVPILNDSPLKLDILDLTTGFKMLKYLSVNKVQLEQLWLKIMLPLHYF